MAYKSSIGRMDDAIQKAVILVPENIAAVWEKKHGEENPPYFPSINEQLELLNCYLGSDGLFHQMDE